MHECVCVCVSLEDLRLLETPLIFLTFLEMCNIDSNSAMPFHVYDFSIICIFISKFIQLIATHNIYHLVLWALS